MTEKMDPAVKKQWVEALQSGDYQQGRGALHRVYLLVHRFCPLGVLCHLAYLAGKVSRRSTRLGYDYGGEIGALPMEVRTWAGLGSLNPRVGESSLAALNDHHELDFSQIADLIEENL